MLLVLVFVVKGCTKSRLDDNTKFLGFLEAQNYNGYKDLMSGLDEDGFGEEYWRESEILFHDSESYPNSDFYLIDSLISINHFEQASIRIDSLLDLLRKSSEMNKLRHLHIQYLKSYVLKSLNHFEQFNSFYNESGIADWMKEGDMAHLLYFLKINWLKADYLRQAGSYEESKAYSYLGLFLLEKHNLKGIFPLLYIKYCNQIAWNFRDDNKKNTLTQVIFYYKKALSLSQENEYSDLIDEICSNLEDVFEERSDTIQSLYYNSLKTGVENDPDDLLMKGYRFSSKSQFNQAKSNFNKGIKILQDRPCNPVNPKLKACLAEVYYLEGKFDSAQYFLDLAWDMKECSQNVQNDCAFYVLLIEFDYLKALDSANLRPISEILEPLRERRKLGYSVIQGTDTEHLSEFLVINSGKILNYLNERIESEKIPIEYQSEIINLIAGAKRNKSNLRIAKASSQKYFAKEIAFLNQRLERLPLNGIHLDSVYYHLSQAYENLDKSEIATIPSKQLEVQEIADKHVVNFLYEGDNYYMYHKEEQNLELSKFDADRVSEFIDSILYQIQERDDCLLETCDGFRQFLGLDDVRDSHLNILPDGNLIGFPFSLLFERSNVEIFYNYSLLNTRVEMDTIHRAKPPLIISYSDLETNRNLSDELVYEELIEGFKECSFLKDSIFENAVFISGKDMTKESVERSLETDLCHISSHALSDTSSQYDVSILLRNEDGEAVPYFGYEILKMRAPKFVFLNACKTGVGHIEVGEGVYSFSKYCQLAGSETVITTMWEVRDEVAADFSKEYYRNWKKDQSALEAFTIAIQILKSKYQDPYDWAPFVLEGNPYVFLGKG